MKRFVPKRVLIIVLCFHLFLLVCAYLFFVLKSFSEPLTPASIRVVIVDSVNASRELSDADNVNNSDEKIKESSVSGSKKKVIRRGGIHSGLVKKI